MELPLIEALDLRPVKKPEPVEWNWPEFPAKVNYFILTGKQMPSPRTITVKIVANVKAFYEALDNIDRTMKTILLVDKRSRRRPLRSWYWHRIAFALGVLAAFATCVYVVVLGWPWL